MSSADFPHFAIYSVGSSGYHIQSLTQDLAQHPLIGFVDEQQLPRGRWSDDPSSSWLLYGVVLQNPAQGKSLGLEQFMLLSPRAHKSSKQRNGHCTVCFTVRTVEESSSVRPLKIREATILQLGFPCIIFPLSWQPASR